MKTFLASSLILASSLAAEDMTILKRGDRAVGAALGQIVDVAPICPARPGQMSCMAYGSVVTVRVALGGCLDSLGGHFHSFRVKNGKGILSFAAIQVANEASTRARCVSMPMAHVKLTVPFEGHIEIENLPFSATK